MAQKQTIVLIGFVSGTVTRGVQKSQVFADVIYERSPTALCVHSPPLSSSLILFTLAGNINNSRSLLRIRFLRWLWSYSTIEKPKDKSAKAMFTRKQGFSAKKPRREGKGHGGGAAACAGFGVGAVWPRRGRRTADKVRNEETEAEGGRGGKGERSRQQTRETDGGVSERTHGRSAHLQTSYISICHSPLCPFVVRMLELQMLQYDHKRMLNCGIDLQPRHSIPYRVSEYLFRAYLMLCDKTDNSPILFGLCFLPLCRPPSSNVFSALTVIERGAGI